MFSETHLIFMLFETNFDFMLFALMLFGNSPFFGNSPDYNTNNTPPPGQLVDKKCKRELLTPSNFQAFLDEFELKSN